MDDELDIRIRKARERGFYIEEGGSIIAAFTSRAEVANWIEDRLGQVPGEVEQERQDIADAQEQFPNVLRASTGPRGWFKGGKQ